MPVGHRKWIVDALRGRDVSALPKPLGAPPQRKRAAKATEDVAENDETRGNSEVAKKNKQSKQEKYSKNEKAKPKEEEKQEKVDLKDSGKNVRKRGKDTAASSAVCPPKVAAREAKEKAQDGSAKGGASAHAESQQRTAGHKRTRPAPELVARAAVRAALLAAQEAEESPEEID